FLFVTQAAVENYGASIKNEQEVLMHLSNMVMEIYAMDTALHRADKSNSSELGGAIVRTFINDAMHRLIFSASQVLAAIDEGERLQTQLSTVRRLLRWMPLNTIQLRHRIAEQLIEQGRYAF